MIATAPEIRLITVVHPHWKSYGVEEDKVEMETQLLLPKGDDESPIKWDLVLETLERLTSQCQDGDMRSSINTENFRNLGVLLQQITKEEILRYDVLVVAFRFLRNSVAACGRNQDAIRQDSTVFEMTANFLQLEGQEETNSNSLVSPDKVVAIRCALQFLANFIVENETNAVLMSSVFSTSIVPLLKNFHQDEKVVQYIAMILHLLLKQCPANITVDQELLSSLLRNLQLEFVIYAMESLVAQEGVLGSLYEDAEPKLRIQLLTFLNERADILNNLNEKAVSLLRDNFVERSDFILKSKVGDSDDVFSWEIAILLETLCGISAAGNEVLKSDSVLMTTVLFLLRQIQEVGKSTTESENAFAPVEDLQKLTSKSSTQSSADDIRAHPTFQFKAHLIRLIANISHRRKSNQDLVRELECLPIILDNCKLDARNPFIGQWSVLALRNLCEGNDVNQSYIREVQRIDTEKLLPKLELVDLS